MLGASDAGADVVELLSLWERRSDTPPERAEPGAGSARVHRGQVVLPEGVLNLPDAASGDVPQSAVATRDGRWCLVTASPGASELSRLHLLGLDPDGGSSEDSIWTVPGRGARGRPAVLSAEEQLALWICGDEEWTLIDLTGDEPRRRSLAPPKPFGTVRGPRLLSSRQPRTWWAVTEAPGEGAEASATVRLDMIKAIETHEGWGLMVSPGPVVPGLRRLLEARVAGAPALILHHAVDDEERLSLHALDEVGSRKPVADPQLLWRGTGLRSLTLVQASGHDEAGDRLVVLRRPTPGRTELLEVPLATEDMPRTLICRSLAEHGEILLSVQAAGSRLSVTSGSQVRTAHVSTLEEMDAGQHGTLLSGVKHTVSLDGTEVPFTWHAHGELEAARGRNAPVMLTVYGGFGVEIGEFFDPSARAWCDAGGVHVTAHVRGGRELGAAWHRGGAGARKHRSVEDLLAVAAHLKAELFPGSCLNVVGASIGGVIAAASAALRPELFSGLVVSGAPVDLARLEENPLGHLWREELVGRLSGGGGSPSLTRVCPTYLWRQQARVPDGGTPGAGRKLPAVLAIAQENDTRVEASHMRDLITLMQEHGMEAELRVNPGAGHGRNTAEAVHRYAAWILAFCARRR